MGGICRYRQKNPISAAKIVRIEGKVVRAVDTTGAGDAFGAGFLYGIINGCDPFDSAHLACIIGAEIVTVEGCDFSLLDWSRIKMEITK